MTVFQNNKLGILSADFHYGIGFWLPEASGFCLCGDFVSNSIGAHQSADSFSTGAGNTHSTNVQITKARSNALQTLAHGFFRIAGSSQILEIHNVAVLVGQYQIGAGRADINAQCTAICRRGAGHWWVLQAGSLS